MATHYDVWGSKSEIDWNKDYHWTGRSIMSRAERRGARRQRRAERRKGRPARLRKVWTWVSNSWLVKQLVKRGLDWGKEKLSDKD